MSVQDRDRTIPPVLTLAQLGDLGETLASDNGESIGIHRVAGELADAGLLFKQYKKTVQDGRSADLDALIAFGRSTATVGREEREILLAGSSWPVAKVTDGEGALVGCLIPEAATRFRVADGSKLREIDTLAQPDEWHTARGLSVTPDQRLAVCRHLVAVAAALESRDLVYSDWNYANALWSPDDHTVFVIDIDGCRPSRAADVFQSGWEDPLAIGSTGADLATDRYRVALLVARCLTGRRAVPSVLHALNDAENGEVPGRELLLDMLWAADRRARPRLRSLQVALDGPEIRFPVVRLALPERPKERTRKVVQPLPTELTRGADETTGTTDTDKKPAEQKPGFAQFLPWILFLILMLLVIVGISNK